VTTLFVSHSADLVRRLCAQAMWIQDGRIRALGNADEVVTAYIERSADLDSRLELGDQRRWGPREVEITGVQFLDEQGRDCRRFRTGEPLVARIRYVAHRRIAQPTFGIGIHRDDGAHINGPNTLVDGYDIEYVEGPGSIDYCVEWLSLLPGAYQLSAVAYDHTALHAYDHHHRVYPFWVEPNPAVRHPFGTIYMPARWEHRAGE
ncbi:MAG: Wzt carbohydrate-binding domain-containing protein, partial [Longimicrobiales bacterium]